MGSKRDEKKARNEGIWNAFSKALDLETGPFNLKGRGYEPRTTLKAHIVRILNGLGLPYATVDQGYSRRNYYPLRLVNRAAQLMDVDPSQLISVEDLGSTPFDQTDGETSEDRLVRLSRIACKWADVEFCGIRDGLRYLDVRGSDWDASDRPPAILSVPIPSQGLTGRSAVEQLSHQIWELEYKQSVAKQKYDKALSQNPSKIIAVHCNACDFDYDVREVTDEVQHSHALHVMAFTCPKGHRGESRRLWMDSTELEKSNLARLNPQSKANVKKDKE